MVKLLFVFGTRPEAIKLAPVIKAFQKQPGYKVSVCVTAQHRQMLDQVLGFFKIVPDYDLNLMRYNQNLFDLTADCLKGLGIAIEKDTPDLILVQGDTTSAFAGALAGYYKKIQVAHIEAGLRSKNKYSPFPEELNRTLIGHIADYHFTPTDTASQRLYEEGISKNVWKVGNTVIDALFLGLSLLKSESEAKFFDYFKGIDFSKRIILVTSHRRESFGRPFQSICEALQEIADSNQDIEIIYPVHLNPNIIDPANEILGNTSNIHLIEPLDYPSMLWLMNRCFLVITDSGGIQEEAPSLGKPVLVIREVTERIEGIHAGTARLVGTSKETIIDAATLLLNDEDVYNAMAQAKNPYGDGIASESIVRMIDGSFRNTQGREVRKPKE